MIMMVINQILLQMEMRPFEANLQAYPEPILQFIHPVLFPLSHYSVPALIESPHVVVQLEATPTPPVHI
jgi:hypothetical protein